MPTIKLYKLYREGNLVKYEAPDGKTYSLDIATPPTPSSEWIHDTDNMIAYSPDRFGADGTLVVSLRGAGSTAATLLHNGEIPPPRRLEADFPRKYYFSTLNYALIEGLPEFIGQSIFILRAEGLECPIEDRVSLCVMVVVP